MHVLNSTATAQEKTVDTAVVQSVKEPKRWDVFLKWFSVISTITAAEITLTGHYYTRGRLDALGLPSGLFPPSAQDIFFNAHLAIFYNFWTLWTWATTWRHGVYLIGSFAIPSLIGVVGAWLTVRPPKWFERSKGASLGVLRKPIWFFASFGLAMPLMMLAISWGVGALGFVALGLPLFGYTVGTDEGTKELARATCKAPGDAGCVTVLVDAASLPILGRILATSDKWIAVRTADSVLILPASVLRLSVGQRAAEPASSR